MSIRIPVPTHLLTNTIVITRVTIGQSANSGAPVGTGATATQTCLGFFQPISGPEAMVYQREEGTLVANIFMHPVPTSGVGSVSIRQHDTITVDGGDSMRVVGVGQNLCNVGTLVMCTVELRT